MQGWEVKRRAKRDRKRLIGDIDEPGEKQNPKKVFQEGEDEE